ncbi:MAG: hypothetical protein ACXAEU_07935 [Candidatus Hodarchaeales archaeon]
MINLQGQTLDEEINQNLELVSELALDAFDRSIDALTERNMQRANENIESVENFVHVRQLHVLQAKERKE